MKVYPYCDNWSST